MLAAAPPFEFQHYSTSHIAVLGTTLSVYSLMAFARLNGHNTAQWMERTLGIILLSLWPVTTFVHWKVGDLDLQNGLPFHLCDVAGITGGLALLTRRQIFCEIVYFFGMAGTLQGLITPNLKYDFPDARFLVFFILHGGVVATALHVVTAMRHAPRAWAVPRMLSLTLGYAAFVGTVNYFLGTNFGFLCHKPEQASLMGPLGPWPWYIASLIGVCLVFYTLLDLPFMISRRRQAARAAPATPLT